MGACCSSSSSSDGTSGSSKSGKSFSLEVTDTVAGSDLEKRKEQQEKWIINQTYYGKVADSRRGSVLELYEASGKKENRKARHEAGSIAFGDDDIKEPWMDDAAAEKVDPVPEEVVKSLYGGMKGVAAMAQVSYEEFVDIVLPKMTRFILEDQTVIFEAGDASDMLLAVEDGKILEMDGESGATQNVLRNGDVINTKALVNRTTLQHKYYTELRCAIWALDRPSFRKCIKEIAERKVEERTAILAGIENLKMLTETEREHAAQAMDEVTFEADEEIMKQGEEGKKFFVIKTGTVNVVKNDKVVNTLTAGSHFGELSLVSNAPASASVIATEKTECLRMLRQDFDLTIGSLGRKREPYVTRVLSKTPGFCTLHPTTMSELTKLVEVRKFMKGDVVLEKGETPKGLFICSGGRLHSHGMADDEAVKRSRSMLYNMRYHPEPRVIKRGTCFGQSALMLPDTNKAVEYTIKAAIPSEALFLPLESFNDYIDSIAPVLRASSVNNENVENALKDVPEFNKLSETEINVLASALSIVYYFPGEVIHEKGAEMDTFFLVEDGAIAALDDNDDEVNVTEAWECCNADCIREVKNAEHRMVSKTYMAALTISKEEFEKVLGSLEEIMADTEDIRKLRCIRNVPLFASLREHQKRSIAGKLEEKVYPIKCKVIKQGEESDAMYYILSGKVTVQLATSSKIEGPGGRASQLNIAELGPGQFFGESALLRDEPRNASVYVGSKEDLVCYVLMKRDMEMGLGRLHDAIYKVQKERAVLTAQKMRDYYGDSFEKHICLRDLFMIKTIGAGAYGMVRMAKHKGTEQRYAVKILGKERLIETGQMHNVVNERKLLAKCNHPNIIKLISVDRDSRHYYMIFEMLQGGELMGLIRTFGRLEHMAARFYTGNVILAFAYLHKQNIVFRDLKPENLLIEASGYLKLIDFGFAKVVNSRTYTLCGTPAYIAPEVVLSEGHDKAVDYWALGVLIFEMMAGYSPFEEGGGGDLAIYERITKCEYTFPKHFDSNAKDVIKQLLQPKSAKRLGNLARGVSDLSEHAWFRSEEKTFSWEKLKARELDPPFRPRLDVEDDMSMFEVADVSTAHLKNSGIVSMDTSEWDAAF